MTVPQLKELVRDAFTPKPETHEIEMVFDVSGWLEDHIANLKNHIYPHVFRFFLGEDGKAKMVYKNWAQDETWRPSEEPLTILETMPSGFPRLIAPESKEKALSTKELEAKITQSSKRMTDAEVNWWKV